MQSLDTDAIRCYYQLCEIQKSTYVNIKVNFYSIIKSVLKHVVLSSKEYVAIYNNYICDRILENGSKSHLKSIVFQHVFDCIST